MVRGGGSRAQARRCGRVDLLLDGSAEDGAPAPACAADAPTLGPALAARSQAEARADQGAGGAAQLAAVAGKQASKHTPASVVQPRRAAVAAGARPACHKPAPAGRACWLQRYLLPSWVQPLGRATLPPGPCIRRCSNRATSWASCTPRTMQSAARACRCRWGRCRRPRPRLTAQLARGPGRRT